MVAQTASLVRVTKPLFEVIARAVEKRFPTKKVTWKSLSRAIGILEFRGGQTDLILVSPRKKREKVVLNLVFDEIRGKEVRAHLRFPFYGVVFRQDEVLKILIGEIGEGVLKIKKKRGVFVQNAGIVVTVNLPFAPVETKDEESGKHGDGQQLFACPEEVV